MAVLHDLAELVDGRCGGKALGLAQLIRAGLPVPPGFAVEADEFARVAQLGSAELDAAGHQLEAAAQRIAAMEVPGDLRRELKERLKELGPVVAVRSSATVEDVAVGAAAGVFSSETGVPARVDTVWEAIKAVWTSALTPVAASYIARQHGSFAIGVVVQQFVAGERITVYTKEPLVIQRGAAIGTGDGSARDIAAIVQARRAAKVLGVPADVELVQRAHRQGSPSASGEANIHVETEQHDHHDDVVLETWVVQARPIVERAPIVLTDPPPIVLAALQDGRVWTWDVTHNPDPISPAQAWLVDHVKHLGPYEMRVAGGYLYTSRRSSTTYAESTLELVASCRAIEAQIETMLSTNSSSVADALARFVAFYELWAVKLSPQIAELRKRVPERGYRPSSVEATLFAAANKAITFDDVVARIGALSASWDVAVPTFGEQPDVLHRAIAIAKTEQTSRDQEASEDIDLASIISDLAERDDLLFARAQHHVRAALLARAGDLGNDVFWIDPSELDQLDPITARKKAAASRAAHDRAAKWRMPLVVPQDAAPTDSSTENHVLRGHGYGRRVSGRVVRFASLAAVIFAKPGDIVVVRAVTPALAVFVGDCAALVSETGGPLDHGAALARELGITCVVGCHEAWSRLHDGALVDVDGDAGTVTQVA
ncbi:MAG: PEP/pyruvate-binding domain-containing protein [Kofleriaceae bacterium]